MVDYNTSNESTRTDKPAIVRVPFVIYGSDSKSVRELKQSVQEEMQQKLESVTLDLPQDQAKAADVAVQNRQFNLNRRIVHVSFDGTHIILSAPRAALDDL